MSKQKTAMQILKQDLIKTKINTEIYYNAFEGFEGEFNKEALYKKKIAISVLDMVISKIDKELFKKEKEQIINSFITGNQKEMRGGKVIFEISEYFYNETFTQSSE